VEPDLITTAKGIAGGLPLAAVTGRADVMDAVHAGGLGGTYGGNPVACAAALGAIATIEQDDLAGRARRIGEVMLPRLESLAQRIPAIGDVRGRGAMTAVEIVRPGRSSRTPSSRPPWRGPATPRGSWC
jgi:4-aminobutyrate aminotransferase/(S)-3-amino-2-methylpropionate transaminase